jgi:hypothetical protein
VRNDGAEGCLAAQVINVATVTESNRPHSHRRPVARRLDTRAIPGFAGPEPGYRISACLPFASADWKPGDKAPSEVFRIDPACRYDSLGHTDRHLRVVGNRALRATYPPWPTAVGAQLIQPLAWVWMTTALVWPAKGVANCATEQGTPESRWVVDLGVEFQSDVGGRNPVPRRQQAALPDEVVDGVSTAAHSCTLGVRAAAAQHNRFDDAEA